jgi:hypothetical protein
MCLSEDGQDIVSVHDKRTDEFQEHVGEATESYKSAGVEP